ncbi:MAG: trypsin-like serine protease [Deltaproteobacteria bacterium]|nr:trypsin-like serine protease [Deltaproteobacteria bacterium]
MASRGERLGRGDEILARVAWGPALALAAMVVAAPGCRSQPPGSAPAVVSRPLIGGVDDLDDIEVVGIGGEEGIFCSGVLLTDRIVATAAHCLDQRTNVIAWLIVTFGQNKAQAITEMRALEVRWPQETFYGDVALVLLEGPAPEGATPRPILRQLDPALIGQVVRMVAFGVSTMEQSVATKVQGTAKLWEIGDFLMTMADDTDVAHVCQADSGGAAYMTIDGTEYLIGLIKAADPACERPDSLLARLDRLLDGFIDPYLARHSDGGAILGERCYWDAQCVTGRCLPTSDLAGFSYCTQDCTPETACPEPMICATPENLCRFPLPSPGSLGTGCRFSTDCESLRCMREKDTEAFFCSEACLPIDWPCSDGFECRDTDDPEEMGCFIALAKPDDHGCAVSPAPGARAPGRLVLLGLLGLVARRFRAPRR